MSTNVSTMRRNWRSTMGRGMFREPERPTSQSAHSLTIASRASSVAFAAASWVGWEERNNGLLGRGAES